MTFTLGSSIFWRWLLRKNTKLFFQWMKGVGVYVVDVNPDWRLHLNINPNIGVYYKSVWWMLQWHNAFYWEVSQKSLLTYSICLLFVCWSFASDRSGRSAIPIIPEGASPSPPSTPRSKGEIPRKELLGVEGTWSIGNSWDVKHHDLLRVTQAKTSNKETLLLWVVEYRMFFITEVKRKPPERKIFFVVQLRIQIILCVFERWKIKSCCLIF